jgi:hypothetical protein
VWLKFATAIGDARCQDVANLFRAMETVQVTRDSEKPRVNAFPGWWAIIEQLAQESRII